MIFLLLVILVCGIILGGFVLFTIKAITDKRMWVKWTRCPFCKEPIQEDVLICKHCHRDVAKQLNNIKNRAVV